MSIFGHHLVLAAGSFAPVNQDYLFEARQMQALSLIVHIPIVCFGIAFPALVLFTELLYLRTGNPLYRTLAQRWSKVMITLFAVGVVTGTILSFEFGLLWPGFMATFGNVFGLGFAFEAFSFFLEAIFIAIYVYGWDRISTRLHVLSGAIVVVTGMTGSLMIIAVNGFMNHPSGFALRDGKAVDVHPWSALFGNSYFWHELVHMYLAAFIVVGFVMASVYAWGALRGRWGRYERTALAIPLTVAALAAPTQMIVGDWVARDVANKQPVKLAVAEGLNKTTKGAAEHVLGWYDGKEVRYGIEIPYLLALLTEHNPTATVEGLDSVPPSERPPVNTINLVRFAFQTMVGIGALLALIGTVFAYVRIRKRRLPESRWFYRTLVLAGPLSFVALVAGWTTTEVGRQPWVVYGVMRTSEAVTGAEGIPVGYGTLVLVYAALAGGVFWVLRRLSRAPLGEIEEPPVPVTVPSGPVELPPAHASR
jgi:cytochrome d ubiquinol oxidase subunit I